MRVLIPSVGYADFLATVLPRWQAFLPEARIIVVTDTKDHETWAVAQEYGAECCVTDIWYEQQPVSNVTKGPVVFNKAAAMDVAFGFRPGYTERPEALDLCLALDCDVVPFGRFPAPREINRHTVYGCPRYTCETPEELAAYQPPPSHKKLIPPKLAGQNYGHADPKLTPLQAGSRCLGYFQLFRYRPGLRFGSYRTAGGYDMDFRLKFTSRRCVEHMHLLHLGEQNRSNWKGRIVKPWLPLV